MNGVRSSKALDELFRVGSSRRVLQSQWQTEGVPFYRGREITLLAAEGFVDNALFISEDLYRELAAKNGVPSAGDIMVTAIGTIGNSYIVRDGDRFYFKDASVLWLKKTTDVSSEFINWWLKSPLFFDQLDRGNGATVDTLTIQKLQTVAVDLPPLPEQQRIVTLLDEAFDGIATAKSNAEKNLQNARAIFESHLQSVFTQRGDGWTEKRLADVCAITSTLVDPRKTEFIDLTHVGAGNIESKTGAFVELKTAREEGLISGKFLFDESMVLYSKIRPYLMKVARPDFNGLCSADMYPLAPIPGEADKDYLFHLLLSKHFTDYAIEGSARAGMPKVNREHLFEFRVFMPSVSKQREIAAKFDDLHGETQRLESIYQQKLTALDELKKSLLHRAFSGDL
jgi:type I restriction enzyme S subunit